MTFAILGSIGAAIAEGAAVAGSAAAAAGSAIGSAAGAIGSGLAAGVGELGAGLGLAGAEAGTAAGTTAGTAAGASGGLGAGAGSGSLIGQAAALGLGGTAETAVPVGSTVSGLASGVGGGAAGTSGLGIAGALPVGTISNLAAPGLLSGLGSFATQQLGGQALSQGIQGIQNAQIGAQNEKAGRQAYMGDAAQQERDRRNAYTIGSQTMGMAAGGEVPLEDGDWIIPADVVSALGNGSTDAGASFLNDFFGLSNGSSGNIA